MNSDQVKTGFQRAPHRSLFMATGIKRDDFKKPFIGVCNSYTDVIPGHCHLNKVAEQVKQCIREAGGVPFEFNTIGICDGIAMGHSGMKYSLPSRELIADCVESMVKAHCFDAMICIPNCDKITPGMILGAIRANIPTIFASGGPMRAGKFDGRAMDLISVFEGVAQYKSGAISEEQLTQIEEASCPGCGSCSGMFTANSMNCLCEAIGLALPGNGSILADDPARKDLWRRAAQRVVEMARNESPRPRDLITRASIDNAFALDMAMGGSSNTVLPSPSRMKRASTTISTASTPFRNAARTSAGRALLCLLRRMSTPQAASRRSSNASPAFRPARHHLPRLSAARLSGESSPPPGQERTGHPHAGQRLLARRRADHLARQSGRARGGRQKGRRLCCHADLRGNGHLLRL